MSKTDEKILETTQFYKIISRKMMAILHLFEHNSIDNFEDP